VLGSTGGATGAGFGLLYFDWRIGALWFWPCGPGPKAYAGVAFYALDSLTPTPSPILPFVVRDIVTVYWVKLDDLRATKYLPQRTLAGRPLD
jgi:hypothetical protein